MQSQPVNLKINNKKINVLKVVCECWGGLEILFHGVE
jgi:hypothetical protein